jgi:hypothetical protein
VIDWDDSSRCVSVVHDDTANLAGLVAEYDKLCMQVEDLTDGWIGAMRADVKGEQASTKPIKRKEVRLEFIWYGRPFRRFVFYLRLY